MKHIDKFIELMGFEGELAKAVSCGIQRVELLDKQLTVQPRAEFFTFNKEDQSASSLFNCVVEANGFRFQVGGTAKRTADSKILARVGRIKDKKTEQWRDRISFNSSVLIGLANQLAKQYGDTKTEGMRVLAFGEKEEKGMKWFRVAAGLDFSVVICDYGDRVSAFPTSNMSEALRTIVKAAVSKHFLQVEWPKVELREKRVARSQSVPSPSSDMVLPSVKEIEAANAVPKSESQSGGDVARAS